MRCNVLTPTLQFTIVDLAIAAVIVRRMGCVCAGMCGGVGGRGTGRLCADFALVLCKGSKLRTEQISLHYVLFPGQAHDHHEIWPRMREFVCGPKFGV